MSQDLSPKMEAGTINSSGGDTDEVELARMGYKQELKYVFLVDRVHSRLNFVS